MQGGAVHGFGQLLRQLRRDDVAAEVQLREGQQLGAMAGRQGRHPLQAAQVLLAGLGAAGIAAPLPEGQPDS